MVRKYIIYIILLFLIMYPATCAYLVTQALETGTGIEGVEDRVLWFQISIWLTWIFLVIVAVYHKWTREKNFFFLLTYGFLLLSFSVFGYFLQSMVNTFNIPSRFQDDYTLGVFTALQNFAVAALLTAFLQAAVWWFTRRWHRR